MRYLFGLIDVSTIIPDICKSLVKEGKEKEINLNDLEIMFGVKTITE